ncbi:hypothetical protein [Tahibacter amnicola]|uniref:Cytochrome P460 n=1 Tax=Tahibacter amnicola TaxID=2976241 RepID=A0ABY6B7A1_9GAMM|nr:hypothetical protein [Tahibacter amnicola]UXI65775.1 hypothetical protein N4264_13475 [Tahibacter amnicola]
MARLSLLPRWISAGVLLSCPLPVASAGPAPLPPFPPDQPASWVCPQSPPEPSPAQVAAWCKKHRDRGKPAKLPLAPAEVVNLEAKNAYDLQLRTFLRERTYRKLGWIADRDWRLTGPYAGDFGDGKSYGVHPAVRVWYSPEVVDWMCSGRTGAIGEGAMIVKEMRSIDPKALGIDPDAPCMVPKAKASTVEPSSWTVMVRYPGASHDGWYWANPTGSGDGNPPILTGSAVTWPSFFGPDPAHPENNPRWYPTGDLFQDPTQPNAKLADIVTPYSQFGAYCIICHASAEKELTYASLDNVLTSGILYRHFALPGAKPAFDDLAGASHKDPANDDSERAALATAQAGSWKFTTALSRPAPGFAQAFGTLGPSTFADAFAFHLPGETFDHRIAAAKGPALFLTSDQCIGCHDATVSNDATPNMLVTDPDTGNAINVSMYGEWRASPMGLAGRDPIFFAQLQSETNNLSAMTECIENTCLHCHGAMGQRQLALDTASPNARCRNLFAIPPPPGVPFGEPFRLSMVTQYQDSQPHATYGNLARDGISCAVCHHIDKEALGTQPSFTGNWVAGPADRIFGPFDTVIPKPMEHALGLTPQKGDQITGSDLCGSCHNILLPVFNNDGTPRRVRAPGGAFVTATYEQTTHLEWRNSDFARGETFRSCQDCHMPTHYKSLNLDGTRIANIESADFAPTTHRLPDKDITLQPRAYRRHALHGLNLFLNEMFQQFPLLLGVRQIDYMGATTTQPGLITASESMTRMANHETAEVTIRDVAFDARRGKLDARVHVVNKTGHYLPSGVGFRRVFLEFLVQDAAGNVLWASGRTNTLGQILDGTTDTPLATERGTDQTRFQPHYERITRGDQVQIYQELIKDSAGELTTSFLRRVHPVKDNRLRPKGFDPKVFLRDPSPYIQILGEVEGEAKNDPHYTDPRLTGSDVVRYSISLSRDQAARAAKVTAVLYSQSIPPSYLQQRFADANAGAAQKDQIQRLYYLTSHLNTDGTTPIADWKVKLVGAQAQIR